MRCGCGARLSKSTQKHPKAPYRVNNPLNFEHRPARCHCHCGKRLKLYESTDAGGGAKWGKKEKMQFMARQDGDLPFTQLILFDFRGKLKNSQAGAWHCLSARNLEQSAARPSEHDMRPLFVIFVSCTFAPSCFQREHRPSRLIRSLSISPWSCLPGLWIKCTQGGGSATAKDWVIIRGLLHIPRDRIRFSPREWMLSVAPKAILLASPG